MKFSIVITTYNRLGLLKRAIASALNQTVPCEVVVADDASCDGTEAYLRSLGDQVVYHRNTHNLNHAATVNAGVNAASGDWVKLLDDDDYLAPDCIQAMVAALSHYPQAVIGSCRAAQVDLSGNIIKYTPMVGPGQVSHIPQAAIHYGMLLDQVPFGTPVQVAVRRDAFFKTGGWDTTMTTNYDDINAWVHLAEYGDALFINDCLAYRTLWRGGNEQKMSIGQRLQLHITLKQGIYARVSDTYRAQCPSLEDLRAYLHLHWGLVALKQGHIKTAFDLVLPVVHRPAAWQLLGQARKLRFGCTPVEGLLTQVLPMQTLDVPPFDH